MSPPKFSLDLFFTLSSEERRILRNLYDVDYRLHRDRVEQLIAGVPSQVGRRGKVG